MKERTVPANLILNTTSSHVHIPQRDEEERGHRTKTEVLDSKWAQQRRK